MAQVVVQHTGVDGANIEIGTHAFTTSTVEVDAKMQRVHAMLVTVTNDSTATPVPYSDLTLSTHKVTVAEQGDGTTSEFAYFFIGF